MTAQVNALGYEVIYTFREPKRSRPAFVVLANRELQRAVVAVRGTQTVDDILTDLTGVVSAFPAKPQAQLGHAHRGMAAAAEWLCTQLEDSLSQFRYAGFEVSFTGHSLGAGVATLATILSHQVCKDVRCFAFE